MRCMKCGTVIQSGTICPHCGNDTSVKESIEFTEDLQQETVETEDIEDVKVNVPEDKPAVQTPKAFTKEAQNEKALVEAMEKFVFYSVLISVIGNLSSIYSFFTGAVYRKSGVAPEEVYEFFGPSLKYLDMAMGFLLIFLTVICVFSAIAIKKRKKYAGAMICAVIAVSVIVTLVYDLLFCHLTGATLNGTLLLGLGVKIIWFAVMVYYFKKCKNVYVN